MAVLVASEHNQSMLLFRDKVQGRVLLPPM
jgi:hypothetical protein